ncbi:MAG: hypothetical protein CVU57_10805 [Deltaproteobacteria bacterium HGW-Deltaproteobacteria-15]|nr:MAG: hypothetical protein CVU57_10805 [Deltaproteobacteria bacterium HGW-Deltaproteobacteria-15]
MHQVENQIVQAMKTLSAFGSMLREDRDIGLLLSEYANAIQRTKLAMEQEGIARACAICDETSRGGCCYPGVEEWYDWSLLAINILLGSDIPVTREIPGACLFVGPRGCRLLARHAFCVNYFCPDLISRLRGEPQNRFNAAAGQELLCGFRLERVVRSRVSILRPSRTLP